MASVPAQGDPGRWARFQILLDAADQAAEQRWVRARGNATLDTAAIVTSNLADYGAIWVVLAAFKAWPRSKRARVIESLAVAGVSSALVNWAVKRVVNRSRPLGPPPTGPLAVRQPTSSSFPSGHTLAAWCTAVVLADSPGEMAAYLTFAAATGLSRVHLRAHHLTDTIGGAGIGLWVGVAARGTLRRRRRPSDLPSTP